MESEDVLPLLVLTASYASFISFHMSATNLKMIQHASERMFDRVTKWNQPGDDSWAILWCMLILAGQCIGQPDKCEILCMACALDSPAVAFAAELHFFSGVTRWGDPKANANAYRLPSFWPYFVTWSIDSFCDCANVSHTSHGWGHVFIDFIFSAQQRLYYMSLLDTDGWGR